MTTDGMRAALVTGPMRIELRDVPAPEVPDDGILVAVRACGVCGSDLRRWREGPAPGNAPLVAGHEIAGVVTAVGRRVSDHRVGERLAIAPDVHCGRCSYCDHGWFNVCDDLKLVGITPGYDGGFAEQMVVTAEILERGVVHRVPESLTDQQAALAEPCSSVLASHADARTGIGDTVVVMGAGPIGCLHICVAKARGARVILSEPSAIRRRMAEPLGPDLILDPLTQDVVEEVRAATKGRGADTVICANPVASTHTQAVELVRKRGTVVLFGGLPTADPMTTLDGNRIHYGEIRVVGSFSYHPSFHGLALEAIERGVIPSEHVITHAFPLADIGRGFEAAAGGEALKVMVTVDRGGGIG